MWNCWFISFFLWTNWNTQMSELSACSQTCAAKPMVHHPPYHSSVIREKATPTESTKSSQQPEKHHFKAFHSDKCSECYWLWRLKLKPYKPTEQPSNHPATHFTGTFRGFLGAVLLQLRLCWVINSATLIISSRNNFPSCKARAQWEPSW